MRRVCADTARMKGFVKCLGMEVSGGREMRYVERDRVFLLRGKVCVQMGKVMRDMHFHTSCHWLIYRVCEDASF